MVLCNVQIYVTNDYHILTGFFIYFVTWNSAVLGLEM